MAIREWVNRNSAVATVVVILVLVVALAFIIRSRGGGHGSAPPPPQWFYCLETEQLFVASAGSIPPIESPWGGDAVEAHVYFCGGCGGEPRIGYLRKYQQDVKQLLDAQARKFSQAGEDAPGSDSAVPVVDTMTLAMGSLVSRPGPIEWVQQESTQGYKLRAEAFVCDEGQAPNRQCHPKQVTTVEPQ